MNQNGYQGVRIGNKRVGKNYYGWRINPTISCARPHRPHAPIRPDRFIRSAPIPEEKVSGRKPWRDRKLAGIIEGADEGDRLLVPELTRLGRSTLEVPEILKEAQEAGVQGYSVKERLRIDDSMQSKVMSTFLSLFAEVERDFISQRTKEGSNWGIPTSA